MSGRFANYYLTGDVKATGTGESDHEVCWVRKEPMQLKYNLTYKTPFTSNICLQGERQNHINTEILCSYEAKPQLTLKKKKKNTRTLF